MRQEIGLKVYSNSANFGACVYKCTKGGCRLGFKGGDDVRLANAQGTGLG